jgi:hypothetical protein
LKRFEKTGSQSKIFQKRNWKSARSLPEKKWLTTKLSVRESEFKLRSHAKSFPSEKVIMKKPSIYILIALVLFAVAAVQAQTPESDPVRRPRVVGGSKARASAKFQSQSTQSQTPARPAETGAKPEKPSSSPVSKPEETESRSSTVAQREDSGTSRHLSANRIRLRRTEAERLMKVRPLPTAMTSPSLDYVTVAALLPETSQIHLIKLAKQTFLTKGTELSLTTTQGLPIQLRIVRANGVNTAVTIFDNRNRSLIPLVVEFPIERRGVFREMAYYTSAHPALLSPEVVKAGQTYVSAMVDLAAKRLRERGSPVAQNIVEVAKRLCVIEHVDHDRFRNENRIALFEEIYSLYALNELDTYRYSVSSAGAGGMVQMIPWTYALMRQRHPTVGLNPDFVLGMRNHGNALEAMLLYMQDTWNDLVANDDVQFALSAKQATTNELMAAAYNSNAAKLPGYIRRGGTSWRTLIPRETQTYLQILQSYDSLMKAKENHFRARRS